MIEGSYQLGLSDLLAQDISSYEYFYSLPENIQKKIESRDLWSLDEMQSYVKSLKNR